MTIPAVLDLATVRALYASGTASPAQLMAEVMARIDRADPAVFISRASIADIRDALADLLTRAPQPNSLPLWGVPYAVKDNIDVADMETTCACPPFAHVARDDATVVAKLRAAGAICLGKTNLDQFATGLNGTRSPYGAPRSVFSAAHISGGSSSGSGVAVAAGLVSFALGTDTAGSGRVPAMLNNVVGIKPTPGLLSTRGLVPACESLDCISIFALNVADGIELRRLVEGFDPEDPWSRHAAPVTLPRSGAKLGVLAPEQYAFFGDEENPRLYQAAQAAARQAGCILVEIDYAPFAETAALLYEGPWVAERQAAFDATGLSSDVLDPSLARIFAASGTFDAVATFKGLHKLQALRRRCEAELSRVDALLLPTAPRTYTVAEMQAEPLANNTALGTYTNFCNLLGLSAIAVPAGFSSAGLPFGVTLVGPAFADDELAALAQRLHLAAGCGSGIDLAAVPPALPAPQPGEGRIAIAVIGAHLSGMPLNGDLLELGAQLVARTSTAPVYRLYVLPGTVPPKPGMIRVPAGEGGAIALEVWSLDAAAFGRFVAAIPPPLGVGKIMLQDGSQVSGFLCESDGVSGAQDITAMGGWRAYIAGLAADFVETGV